MQKRKREKKGRKLVVFLCPEILILLSYSIPFHFFSSDLFFFFFLFLFVSFPFFIQKRHLTRSHN